MLADEKSWPEVRSCRMLASARERWRATLMASSRQAFSSEFAWSGVLAARYQPSGPRLQAATAKVRTRHARAARRIANILSLSTAPADRCALEKAMAVRDDRCAGF